MKKQSVKKNYIYNLLYQMLAVVIPLLITPYVSRVLGAGNIGAFSYTTAVTGYFVLFGNLGIATYGQLRIAAFRNDKKKVSQIFYELVLLRFCLMAVMSLLFIAFIQLVTRPEYRTLYAILLVQIAASADGRTLYIGARSFHLAPGMTAPAALEKIEAPENWRARMLAKLRKES